MGLYNFEPRFVPNILDGTKTHTIRALREHPDRPGSTLHLYTGLRHKGARLLMRVKCVRIERIRMELYSPAPGKFRIQIWIDGHPINQDEAEVFARRDGFFSFADMEAYWFDRLPFTGQIIHWTFTRKETNS